MRATTPTDPVVVGAGLGFRLPPQPEDEEILVVAAARRRYLARPAAQDERVPLVRDALVVAEVGPLWSDVRTQEDQTDD